MKFILDNWMLIAVALSSGVMLMLPALQGAGQGGLTPAAAVQLINREKAVVVDIRSRPRGGCQKYPLGATGREIGWFR